MEHLRKKDPLHRTSPKRFDEVIYTPFAFKDSISSELVLMDLMLGESGRQGGNIQNVEDFLEQNIDADGLKIPGR